MNTMNTNSTKKGFTLVELLIVIGILAVLGTTAVVILNPAQLLAQARDGQRIQDLNSINSALALYSADVSSPDFGAEGNGKCTVDPAADKNPFGDHTDTNASCVETTDRTVGNGTGTANGWVDVDLAAISGGSPLSTLPIDPTNDDTYLYGYVGDDTNNAWELNARLESDKHRDEMDTDGGNSPATGTCTTYIEADCWYEIGTDPGLDL